MPGQINIEDIRPVVGRPTGKVGAAANVVASVVDENVDRTEVGRDRFEKPVDARMIRHVELEGMREWAKRPGKLGHGLDVDVRERDLHAALYERGRDRPAYPASGARHQSFASA